MTDGFRCDGCDEWWEEPYKLFTASMDVDATAHPSLSLDDLSADAFELLPDDHRGDFCPRCGRKAIAALVELFDEAGDVEEVDVPDHIREALPDSSHAGDMLILEYEERFLDIEFEEVPCGECGETVQHQIETDSYLGEKTTECSNCHATDAVDTDAILEADDSSDASDSSEGTDSIEGDEEPDSEQPSNPYEPDDLGTFTVRAKDEERGAGIYLTAAVSQHFGDVDRVHVRELGEGFELAPGESEEWPDYALTEKSDWVGPPAMDVLDVVEGDEVVAKPDGEVVLLEPKRVAERPADEAEDIDEAETAPDQTPADEESDGDEAEDGKVLGTYEVKDYSTGPTLILGSDVAGEIDADRATVRGGDGGATLTPGESDEWPDYTVQESGEVQLARPGVETIGASPGDEVTAVAEGDGVRLEVDAVQREVPPPDDEEGDEDMVWVKSGHTGVGHYHRDRECPRLSSAKNVTEKPLSVLGEHEPCSYCCPEAEEAIGQGGEGDLGLASDLDLDGHQLTESESAVLEALIEEGEASAGVLETVSDVGSVHSAIRGLREQDLVEARPDPDDGRRKLYRPSEVARRSLDPTEEPDEPDADDDREDDEEDDEEDDDAEARGPRCGECDIDFEDTPVYLVHHTEVHGAEREAFGNLAQGEFASIVERADAVGDIADATGFSTERILRLLNIYDLDDVVGPSDVELSDVTDVEFDSVATNGGGGSESVDDVGDEAAAEEFETRVSANGEEGEGDGSKYGHLVGDEIDEDPSGEVAHQSRPDGGAVAATGGAAPSTSSTHPQRTCQNCGAQVSKQYARVHTPEGQEEQGPRVCPNCPDKVREGDGSVREARSPRRGGR